METKNRRVRVTFEESGGGWGNPLLGNVFDSNRDVGDDAEFRKLVELVKACGDLEPSDLPPPTDTRSFSLKVVVDGHSNHLHSDMIRSNEAVKNLVTFCRSHSRREQLH